MIHKTGLFQSVQHKGTRFTIRNHTTLPTYYISYKEIKMQYRCSIANKQLIQPSQIKLLHKRNPAREFDD